MVKPPEDASPRAITDLRAANTSDGVALTWSRPRQYVDGSTLMDLGRFTIERAIADDRQAATTLTTLEVNDRERFRQTRTFRYVDHTATLGSRYLYRVISSTIDGYTSGPSNAVIVQRELPPPNDRANAATPTAR